MLCGRVASVSVLALIVAAWPPAGARPTRPDVVVLAALGALDVAANLAYAGAVVRDADATVAVHGSLYPLTTVLLARALLHEQLGAPRLAGVVAVLTGRRGDLGVGRLTRLRCSRHVAAGASAASVEIEPVGSA